MNPGKVALRSWLLAGTTGYLVVLAGPIWWVSFSMFVGLSILDTIYVFRKGNE